MAPLGRKGEKEATGSSDRAGPMARQESATRGPFSCGSGWQAEGWPRMVVLRGLGLLLLLLLASGNETSTRKQESPRNVCLRFTLDNHYDTLALNSTATCFTKCRLQKDLCDLGILQRYWLNYESHLVENSLTEVVNMSFVKALVQNFSTDTSEDLHFSLMPYQIPRQMKKNEDKAPDRVRLPKSFFGSLRDQRAYVRLAITVLDIGSGNLFKGPRVSLEDDSSVLNNRLVGLSVGQMQVSGLDEPLEITFSHQRQPPNMTLTCVFWDVSKGPTGDWASEGCSTESGAEGTVCRCNHLTFFALLLRPVLDETTVHALTRISQAGCGVSMVFLALTIVLYLAMRFYRHRFNSEDAPKIHVSLSVSLFLLNLVFFVNMGSGVQGSGAACWARGAAFHYFLLSTFTWMCLEAFHLYLLVIRVFNTYFGHYFLKLSLVGWGLPALVVFAAGCANSYGRYTIRNAENRTTLELCWFYNKIALYPTVHGYFLITFLFAAVVLGLVAWKIFTLSSARAGKEHKQTWKGALTVLGLSSLVGVTWGLAGLTPLGLSTVYIFALFNSLQGIFIFTWVIVLYFPRESAGSSSSGTTRANQAHSVTRE
ncbi:LOW QUALITY PROTEIN: adhesion G protein-coupled receptor G3 [Tamandua tetradactyla]|uniref:LOW QUALITY PROTEIN: adhesion G protein-coupled receptor G3 n=1 Tax=Tamandua tetradactyla TaxID=48850 RepID=UPI0040539A28